MNFSFASISSGMILLFFTIVIFAFGVIFFALHIFGTVETEVSHGKTSFKLKVKDRK